MGDELPSPRNAGEPATSASTHGAATSDQPKAVASARTEVGNGNPSSPAIDLSTDAMASEAQRASDSSPATRADPAGEARPGFVRRSLLPLLRRFFWLDEALARSRAATFRDGHAGWSEFRLARAALAQGDFRYSPDAKANPTLLLYRSAARLMIEAHLARAGQPLDASEKSDGGWAKIADLPLGQWLAANLAQDELDLVTQGLSGQGEGWLARLPSRESRRAALALRRAANWLAEPLLLDATEVSTVLRRRWLRIGSVLLVAFVAGWLGWPEPHNYARDSGVTVTVLNPDPRFSGDPMKLVDACRTNLGFHTTGAGNVVIDLGKAHEISRVVVYNRADCCQDRAVPMKLDISEDGRDYRQIAVRDQTFDAWTVKFGPERVRYVRLVSMNTKAGFHLSEVEVF